MTPKSFPASRLSLLTLTASALLLTACAGSGASYRPIVDAPQDAQYTADLGDCQNLAEQRKIFNGDTQTAILAGAATGGVLGLLRRGDDGDNFLQGAAAGGAVSGISGSFKANKERKNIVRNCMAGRGYRVLG